MAKRVKSTVKLRRLVLSVLQTSIVKHFDTMHRVVKLLVGENGEQNISIDLPD